MGIQFVNLAQVSVILAQQDSFVSLVPVKRKRLKNLNFIVVALKYSGFGEQSPMRGSCAMSVRKDRKSVLLHEQNRTNLPIWPQLKTA